MVTGSDIAVVIPAFQAADHLSAAVDSVLAQDPAPREVIVVDDGSTDGTTELLGPYGSAIDVIRQSHRGEAAARNTGLRTAGSKWVAFLDADDRFLPGRLAALADRLAGATPLDVITTNGFLEMDGDLVGRCYGPQWAFAHQEQRLEILRRNFVFGHVVASRRRLFDLGGYDERITHTTDWALWIRHLLRGGQVDLIDEELSVYRIHPFSQSADRLAMAEGSLASLLTAREEAGLGGRERVTLEHNLRRHHDLVDQEMLMAALERGATPTVRRCAARVALNDGQPAGQRARAGLTLVLPRLGVAAVRRRRQRWSVGTTGRRVRRPPASSSARRPRLTVPRPGPPLVSVVLPFLDEERFLAEAISSVTAQSSPLWELLLVDDGSADSSPSIAEAAAAADPRRVRVVRHTDGRNHGLAASRNLGLSSARAPTIAFLDADDRWHPDKLRRQLRLLADHPTVAMVAGPTWHESLLDGSRIVRPVTASAPRTFRCGEFAVEIVRERLVMPPPPSAVMYRRVALRAVGGVPAGDSLYEDQRTFVAVNIAQPVLITDDEPMSTYTRRPDSLFGSLEDAPATKSAQRRTFEWWVIGYGAGRGLVGWRIVGHMVSHRLIHAVRRRWARWHVSGS